MEGVCPRVGMEGGRYGENMGVMCVSEGHEGDMIRLYYRGRVEWDLDNKAALIPVIFACFRV